MYTDQEFFDRWGMTREEKKSLLEKYPEAAQRYKEHKKNAYRRRIGWGFTLKTWWDVWDKSGKWAHRGAKSGHYVMARFKDIGPYSPTNVEIILHTKNVTDVWGTKHGVEKMMLRKPRGPRGINDTRKIPDHIVVAIRSEYVKWSSTHGTLALGKKYGVSPSHIAGIVNNKKRTDVK